MKWLVLLLMPVLAHAQFITPPGVAWDTGEPPADDRVYPVFVVPMVAFEEREIMVEGVNHRFYAVVLPEEIQFRASTNNFETVEYAWCSDGELGPTWLLDEADHDARLFFANDSGSRTLKQWISSGFLTSQMAPGSTPGMTVVFQPSRYTADGTLNDWMRADNDQLVWTFVLQTADGSIEFPGEGTGDMWSPIVPVEWRKERITLEGEQP